MVLDYFKKFLTPLNLIFFLEILAVLGVITGWLPRQAVLIWTGVAVIYVLFFSFKNALWLLVASIPLFVALPITQNFDTLANWRVLVLALFVRFIFDQRSSLNHLIAGLFDWRQLRNFFKKETLALAVFCFLLIAALSIGVAPYKIVALRKFIFLINALALYFIVREVASSKEGIWRVWQAAAVGGSIALAVAGIQFFGVLFVKLYSFWQFWADYVIGTFYGERLAHLLSYSNSWFAYYSAAPPTLRLFSVFPDSHSFAMFLLISMPIFLTLALLNKPRSIMRSGCLALMVLALGGIIFSGSRGAWLSLIPVAAAALYFFNLNLERPLLKKVLFSFLLFGLLFILSAGYPPIFYKIHAWQTGEYGTSTFSFFERVRSISDLDELSNKTRLQIWGTSLRSIVRHPLLGVGLGNYTQVLGEDISAAKEGASAHNLYLDFASEIGLLGALALLAIFYIIGRTSWLVFRRSRDRILRFYALLFGLYFLWLLVYSLFDVVLLNDKVLLLFVTAVATLDGVKNLTVGQKND